MHITYSLHCVGLQDTPNDIQSLKWNGAYFQIKGQELQKKETNLNNFQIRFFKLSTKKGSSPVKTYAVK